MDTAFFLPAWPPEWPEAATLGLLVLVAMLGGELGARVRLPRLIGQTLAGLGFGLATYGLSSFGIAPLTGRTSELALGAALALVSFEVGRQAPWGWLKRNRGLLATSLSEAALSFAAVTGLLWWLGIAPVAAALTGAVCMASSPAVVMAVAREARSQGQITERALLLAALNSAYAVLLTTVLLGWVHVEARGAVDVWVLHPLYVLCGSLLLAWLAEHFVRRLLSGFAEHQAAQLMIVLIVVGIVFLMARSLRLSPLLATLALGALCSGRTGMPRVAVFDSTVGMALIVFFALSAIPVDFGGWDAAWQIGLAVLFVRWGAKAVAVIGLSRVAGLPARKGAWLALSLGAMSLPMLQLVRDIDAFDRATASQVGSVVVVVAVLMQLVGAAMLAWGLRATGEVRLD